MRRRIFVVSCTPFWGAATPLLRKSPPRRPASLHFTNDGCVALFGQRMFSASVNYNHFSLILLFEIDGTSSKVITSLSRNGAFFTTRKCMPGFLAPSAFWINHAEWRCRQCTRIFGYGCASHQVWIKWVMDGAGAAQPSRKVAQDVFKKSDGIALYNVLRCRKGSLVDEAV